MPVKNTLIHYFIVALLATLSVKHDWLWLAGLALYLGFVLAKKMAPMVIMLLVAVFFLGYAQFYQINDQNYEIIQGTVASIEDNHAIIATARTRVLVYFDEADFDNDDQVGLTLAPMSDTSYKNPWGFNYPEYLKTQGISQVAWMTGSTLIKSNYGVKDFLASRFPGNNQVDSYSKMFIMGVKDEDIDSAGMVELSIIHLFALSGMHLDYLKELLKKVFGFFVGRTYLDIISYAIIGIYLLNIPFNIAFTRAFGMGLFWWLFNKSCSKLDCFALVGLVFLLKNPYMIFSLSFIFSFAIYLILLLLGSQKFSDIIIYLGALPLMVAVNYRINLVGMILALVIGPFVKWFYLAIVVNAMLANSLAVVIDVFISTFENILALSWRFSLFLNFGHPSPVFLGIYYFYYFIMVARISGNLPITKDLIRLLGFGVAYSLFLQFNPIGQVVMIDVGQGDCFLVRQPFNQGNILIDTGGNVSFDIAKNVTVPYLRALGVFELDYVILSHDDFDHSGAYESLKQLMPIKKTITQAQGEIVVGQVHLDLLELPEYDNKNDNSVVVHTKINDLYYLFLGDVSKTVEQDIVNNYPDLPVDVLKVSHHGSNTATSEILLQTFKPKIALVSVGAGNPYRHPNQEVISLLESYGVTIFRTDQDGSLAIRYLPFGRNYLFPYRL